MGCGASSAEKNAVKTSSVVPADASTVGVDTTATAELDAALNALENGQKEQTRTGTAVVSVAGKTTTLVEIGDNGKFVLGMSEKPLTEAEQVLLVVDPRCVQRLCAADLGRAFEEEEIRKKVTSFVLLPSTTSSPECLLCAEVGLQFLLPPGMPEHDIRLVRTDDYFHHGQAILVAMMEEGKKVYPAEEVGAMAGFLKLDPALGYTVEEEGSTDIVEQCSRFKLGVYDCRAWCHWAVGHGMEEGSIIKSQEQVLEVLSVDSHALPSLGPVPSGCKAPGAVWGRGQTAVLVAFNEAAATKYSAIFGKPVMLCKGLEESGMLLESSDLEALSAEQQALLTEEEKACLHVVHMTEKGEEGWEEDDEDEGQEEGQLRKEARGTMDVDAMLDSINQKVRLALGRINGLPTNEALGGLFGAEADKLYPIVLMDHDDLKASSERQYYDPACMQFISKYRESRPDTTLTAVLFDKDFDSFVGNKWLPLALNQLMENADNVFFATDAEASQVAGFFFKTRFESEQVVTSLAMQQVPFPRLHFFTLSTALGQELDTNEILTPAVTVGTNVSGLPAEKFNAPSRFSALFLTDPEFKPLTERLVPGADGFEGTTVIQPARLLARLFEGCLPRGGDGEELSTSDVSWPKLFGEAYSDWDNNELQEAVSNCTDLMLEYNQYSCMSDGRKVSIQVA